MPSIVPGRKKRKTKKKINDNEIIFVKPIKKMIKEVFTYSGTKTRKSKKKKKKKKKEKRKLRKQGKKQQKV